jgi:hypothetical protein
VPGVAVVADESVPAGTVQLVIGGDFNGIGTAVTAAAPEPSSGEAPEPRTATDTSCIY